MFLGFDLRNLLLGEDNILSNREMHIGYVEIKEAPETIASRKDAIIELLRENPKITLSEVAEKIGKSLRTVKTVIKDLQEKGLIERVGGKKNGSWKVINSTIG